MGHTQLTPTDAPWLCPECGNSAYDARRDDSGPIAQCRFCGTITDRDEDDAQ
jgi:rubrerythrin